MSDIKFHPLLDEPLRITVDLSDDYEDVKEFTVQLTDEGIIVDFGDYTLNRTFSEFFDLVVEDDEARHASRMNHPAYGDKNVDVWEAFNLKK